MKATFLRIALAGFTALLIGACTTTNPAPTAPPSGTVTIKEWSAAYYGSVEAGKGTLNFNGKVHRFTITGVGAGGSGAQKVTATGKVYNLTRLQDFAGLFTGVSSGLTLIEGQMHAKLTNGNGVTMYIAGSTEGLASSTGVQEFKVTLTD